MAKKSKPKNVEVDIDSIPEEITSYLEEIQPEDWGDAEKLSSLKMTDRELSPEEQKRLIEQVQAEFKLANDHLAPKLEMWRKRLKLYSNQKRKQDKAGEPLLFTVLQTILASLYDDRMSVKFTGRSTGDFVKASNLQQVAEYDYDKMGKDMLDYYWNWNTLFYGRACILFSEFNQDLKRPVPQLLDPLVLLHDPEGSSVNSEIGQTPVRWIGWEASVTRRELEANKDNYMHYDQLIESKQSSLTTTQKQAIQARNEAQGRNTVVPTNTDALGDNQQIKLIQWFTHFNGKKVLVTTTSDRETIVRYRELEGDVFPIIDKAVYPMPNDWDGVSIPDLVEDKQRLIAVLLNSGLQTVVEQLYPTYLYNIQKIVNPTDLQSTEPKVVGVKGSPADAVLPMRKDSPNVALYDYIRTWMDHSAQKATATPELQQGMISKEERTLGELNIVASRVSTRYSLMAKLFEIAERNFWLYWYQLYKDYFDEFQRKVVRIDGEFNSELRLFKRENIVGVVDPDIDIESKMLSEAKRIKALNNYMPFMQQLMQDPEANRRYALKKLAQLLGFKPAEIDALLPPTAEEIKASNENLLLNRNVIPKINETDDHRTHLLIHQRAYSGSKAKIAHMMAHEKALREQEKQKKMMEELVAQAQPQAPRPTQSPVVNRPMTEDRASRMVQDQAGAEEATRDVISKL